MLKTLALRVTTNRSGHDRIISRGRLDMVRSLGAEIVYILQKVFFFLQTEFIKKNKRVPYT